MTSSSSRLWAPCTAVVGSGERRCYHHDPARAEERRRNASRAATISNSKIDAEIKATRLMVRDLVETTVANELHPLVKKRLTDIVGLLQSYCRLTELELAAGGRPKFSESGEYGLPDDTAEKAKEWAGREAEKAKFMETIGAFNKNPMVALEKMRGD